MSDYIYVVAGLIVALLTLILWETERADTATGRGGVQSEPKIEREKCENNKCFIILYALLIYDECDFLVCFLFLN